MTPLLAWRSAVFVIGALAIGLAFSIAIAWAATWRSPSKWNAHGQGVFDRTAGYTGITDRTTALRNCMYFYSFQLSAAIERGSRLPHPDGSLAVSPFNEPPHASRADPPLTIDVYAAGWPMPCLRRARISPPYGAFAFGRDTGWKFRGTWLPTLPYWPGLLANTAFWGLPALLIALGFGSLRRARRKRRGLCVACAYDLSGGALPVCPECGATR